MSKPKLLVLGSTLPKTSGDGTPAFVLDLAKEQTKKFDVTLLSPFIQGAKTSETMDGVRVLRYRYWPFAHTLADGAILDNLKAKRSNYLQVPFLMAGLFLAIRKAKPELIHAHWVIPQALVATLAAPKAKLLVTTHGGDIYALNQAPLRFLKRFVMRRARAITTVNSQMRDSLTSMGIDSSKIQVIPMGVDIKKAQAGTHTRIPGQLIVVGRLVEKKGIEYLLEAISKGISQKSLPTTLQLMIAGDGPLRKVLEAKAKGLPVTFLGNQTSAQVRKLFATSEIALLPSIKADSGDQEGLPVTLLEAAAAGAFVIASDLAGINDVIEDGVSGFLTQQRDPASILHALERAFADQGFRSESAKNLQTKVQVFDHSVIGKKYNDLIESIR